MLKKRCKGCAIFLNSNGNVYTKPSRGNKHYCIGCWEDIKDRIQETKRIKKKTPPKPVPKYRKSPFGKIQGENKDAARKRYKRLWTRERREQMRKKYGGILY